MTGSHTAVEDIRHQIDSVAGSIFSSGMAFGLNRDDLVDVKGDDGTATDLITNLFSTILDGLVMEEKDTQVKSYIEMAEEDGYRRFSP